MLNPNKAFQGELSLEEEEVEEMEWDVEVVEMEPIDRGALQMAMLWE